MEISRRIEELSRAAATQGVASDEALSLSRDALDFARALPILSDLRDVLASASAMPKARGLADEADAIIGDLQILERAPPESLRSFGERALVLFDAVKTEYPALFASCSTLPQWTAQVDWHVARLTAGRPAYERVAARAGAPWYFVGILHGLEASFRFSGHLHNGDPLTAKTVHVPAGRPNAWNPPNDWDSSAMDALALEGFLNKADWSLARILYRFEAYNGFGSRRHGINSPYLWSFSNHYTRGKYAADGMWDANLVSKQCGAAVMLRALVDRSIVTIAGA